MNAAELKKILHYNPDTGDFTYIVRTAICVKIGGIAGTKRNGYIRIKINGKSYSAHRLAWLYMTGELPENEIDHDNRVRDDNRWVNINKATAQENSKNRSKRSDNSTGVTGVYWHKIKSKWQSSVGINRKSKHLGYFDDKFEAICCRKSAENKFNFHVNHGV